MFAVISHNGNQYKVALDGEYKIDKMELSDDQKKITFEKVLLANDGSKTIVGTPAIDGAFVEADLVGNVVDDKVEVFKFKAKKRYKRTGGHRQTYTVVKVTKISLKNEK